jgi:hypothetical protein
VGFDRRRRRADRLRIIPAVGGVVSAADRRLVTADQEALCVIPRLDCNSWTGSAGPQYHHPIQVLEHLFAHRIPNERNWAGRQIEHIREEIERQSLYEDERWIRYS